MSGKLAYNSRFTPAQPSSPQYIRGLRGVIHTVVLVRGDADRRGVNKVMEA